VSRPKRLANRSYVGQATYFLTFCVLDRRPVFKDAAAASDALKHFQRTAAEESFELLAYVVMPDHAHLLVKTRNKESDLRRFVKMSKQRSGYEYKKRCDKLLWQEGYFERVLRDNADARQYAAYIVNNPVRAGLVTRAADYEHVGSTQWGLEELTDVAPNKEGSSKLMHAGSKGPGLHRHEPA